jgi:capsular polysaccharide biosynthesis protein
VNALRDLADFHFQKAKQTYSEYKQIRQEVANKKRLPNKKSAVLKLLDTTINYLNSALNNYQKLVKLKPQNTLTDIDLNLDSIQEALINLAKEKASVAQYFKE